MNRGFGRTLAAAALMVAVGGVTRAADPQTPADAKAFDKSVVSSLRDVHNHGADLYNVSKDYAGAYRVYEGALRAVKPLLGHHPDIQKTIDDGLTAAGKEADAARHAFLLHETIEKVRADLKTATAATKPVEPKKPVEAKPVEPKKSEAKMPDDFKKSVVTPPVVTPPVEPKKPVVTPVEPKKPVVTTPPEPKKPVETTEPAPLPKLKDSDGAVVSGVVTYQGKPLAAGELTLVSLEQKNPKVVTVAVKDGKYTAKGLPPGKYKVMVDGGKDLKLPAKYATADTSGLTVEVKSGANKTDLDLK